MGFAFRGPRASSVAGRWAAFALLALALAPAACRSRGPGEPMELTLVNRTAGPVDGALLRFEGPLARVDRLSPGGFTEMKLRLAPANTLRLEGGTLEPAQAATYEIAGVEDTPRLVEARWIVGSELGPELRDQEIRTR